MARKEKSGLPDVDELKRELEALKAKIVSAAVLAEQTPNTGRGTSHG